MLALFEQRPTSRAVTAVGSKITLWEKRRKHTPNRQIGVDLTLQQAAHKQPHAVKLLQPCC